MLELIYPPPAIVKMHRMRLLLGNGTKRELAKNSEHDSLAPFVPGNMHCN